MMQPPTKKICDGLTRLASATIDSTQSPDCNTTVIPAKERAIALCHKLGTPARIGKLIEDYQTWLAPRPLSITDQDTATSIVRAIITTYAAYKQGHPDTPPLDLSRLNLSGLDLSYLPLSLANLSNCNLSRASLDHSDLRGALLAHSDLRGARLEHSDLRGARLESSDLREASLKHCDLSGARLEHCDLRGANLSLANLNASVIEATNLKKATLYMATLLKSRIRHCNFEGSNMIRTVLKNAELSNSCLDDADLRMCRFDSVYFAHNTLRHTRIDIRDLDKWRKITPSQQLIIDCDQVENPKAVASVKLDGYCVSSRLLRILIAVQNPSLPKVRWGMKISLEDNKEENAILSTLRNLGVNIQIDVLGYNEDTLQNRSLAMALEPLLKAPHHYYFLDKEMKSKLEQLLPELTAYLQDWATRIQQGSAIPPHG